VARLRAPLWNMEERYRTEVQQRRLASTSSSMTVSVGSNTAGISSAAEAATETAGVVGAADAATTTTTTSSSKLSVAIPSIIPLLHHHRRPDCTTAPDFIAASCRLLVITGAGVSTESSIPDYRSPTGASSTGFKPMTHMEFMRNDDNRRRYWARSFVGWKRFAEQTEPNDAHHALAELQSEGHVWSLITQNVDRLHQAAGSTAVLELHGTSHEVVCMGCGITSPRRTLQRQFAALNPQLAAAADAAVQAAGGHALYNDGVTPPTTTDSLSTSFSSSSSTSSSSSSSSPFSSPSPSSSSSPFPSTLQTRPDGDVELNGEAVLNFTVPPCGACGPSGSGGPLKPAVVFFGDSVPPAVAGAAKSASEAADAVLIIGSSVSTFSAFRLVKDAASRGVPVAILSVGKTHADALCGLKVQALAGETLPRVLEALRREAMYGY